MRILLILTCLFWAGRALGQKPEADSRLDTQLIDAVSRNDAPQVAALLGRDANPNARDKIGDTALAIAAAKGEVAVIDALIRGGADWRVRTTYGRLPLVEAARNGHNATVEALLDHGADANRGDREGSTAL